MKAYTIDEKYVKKELNATTLAQAKRAAIESGHNDFYFGDRWYRNIYPLPADDETPIEEKLAIAEWQSKSV